MLQADHDIVSVKRLLLVGHKVKATGVVELACRKLLPSIPRHLLCILELYGLNAVSCSLECASVTEMLQLYEATVAQGAAIHECVREVGDYVFAGESLYLNGPECGMNKV